MSDANGGHVGKIKAENVPPTIRDVAYELAGAFFGENRRTERFRLMTFEGRPVDEYTFAMVCWPQFVNLAVDALTTTLTCNGISFEERLKIQEELALFNARLDARADSVIRGTDTLQ